MAPILQFTAGGVMYTAEVSDGLASVFETRLLPSLPMSYMAIVDYVHELIDPCLLPDMPEENAVWTADALGCLSQIRGVAGDKWTTPIVLMRIISS